VSPQLRQSLAALIQAFDQGLGPVERQARARRAAGAPMTDGEIAAFAEIHYPIEVRQFLHAHGQQALLREDLARALALNAPVASAPPAAVAGATSDPGRKDRRAALAAKALRLAVLALGVAAGGLILQVGLPKIRAEGAPPRPVPTVVVVPEPLPPPPEDTPCRQALRTGAGAWCESALTGTPAPGTPAPGPTAGTTSEACGDSLAANSDTVRLALNGLLDDGVIGTYERSDASGRCAAAAKLAVP
jgi:hypothetical protein